MARLSTNIIYGLRTDVQQNVHYVKDDDVVYAVGKSLAIHNYTKNLQRIIPLAERYQINIIDVSPNKKFAALCEYGEKPAISVYNLQTSKRVKSLGIPFETTDVSRFKCISFSFDSKNIAAIADGVDQMMLFYNWEKGKVESSIKLGNPQNVSASVSHVACNPTDVGITAVAGYHVFKFLTVSETQWRPYGFSKADNLSICSIAWINGERLFAGTEDGKILFLENGDLKNVFLVHNLDLMNLKLREENAVQMATMITANFEKTSREVYCIKVFPKGLAFAYGIGRVLIFEKEGNHKLIKSGVYLVPERPLRTENNSLYKINNITINSTGEKIVVSAGWSQLFWTNLWNSSLEDKLKANYMELLGEPLHHGSIKYLITCAWKSMVLTYGEEDRCLKIWNFRSETMVLMKQFNYDLSCISLHPTGLYCFIGFIHKVKLMSISVDDLIPTRDLAVSNCRNILFSRGGHLFAIVVENVIKVYITVNFNQKFILKGHVKQVDCLEWSYDDSKLYSVGLEGAIYEWDMNSGNRVGEVIFKNVLISDIAVDLDVRASYCVSDHFIRKIQESEILNEINIKELKMSLIKMGRITEVIFLACKNGAVASVKPPLHNPVEYVQYNVHNKAITQMRLTYNEDVLVTSDTSGTLCFWKLHVEEEVGKFIKNSFYISEVLISSIELIEKNQYIRELTLRLKELQSKQKFNIRQLQIEHDSKMAQVHQVYSELIEELKSKIQSLEEFKMAELRRVELEITELKSKNEKTLREMETDYEFKLKTEYEKYDDFEKEFQATREAYESQLTELEKMKNAKLEATVKSYMEIITEKEETIAQLNKKLEQETEDNKKIIALLEDDADREIVEIRTNCGRMLHEEKEKFLNLEGEVGAYRIKFTVSQEENKNLKDEISKRKEKVKSLQRNIDELKSSKQELQKNIKEANLIIDKKEKQLSELNKNNQELEKYKTILNYKINESQDLIEAREQEKQELVHKTAAMQVEIQNLNKVIKSFKVQLNKMQENLSAAHINNQTQAEIVENYKCLLKKMRWELFDAVEVIQNPKEFRKLIVWMHQRYNQNPKFLLTREEDFKMQNELKKHNIKLKSMLEMLQKNNYRYASPAMEIERKYKKQLDDNEILIRDLSECQQKNIELRKKINNMEAILGFKTSNVSVFETRRKLNEILNNFEESKDSRDSQLTKLETMIKELKEENNKLMTQLAAKE